MSYRRRTIAILVACILFIIYRISGSKERLHVAHDVAKGDGPGKDNGQQVILPDLRDAKPSPPPWKDVFPAGTPKPPGSEYTRTIVMARIGTENVSWVDEQLGDLMTPNGPFSKAIYVADDYSAPLHPIKNKGHEAMIYLSYIIEHWDTLPDVSIFVHADRWTWHNNELMENDLAGMIRYLSPDKVVRDGYMNLRCHWDPGCPDWLHLQELAPVNLQEQEEQAISEMWRELFPVDEMPSVLSQPCCAQFALSKERIRAISLARYKYLQNWILRTPLDDYRSGRVFEYLWQYIFTGNAVVCPSMHVCYCDGYGVCFGGEDEFNEWFKFRYEKVKCESRIRRLKGEHLKGEDGHMLAEVEPEPEIGSEREMYDLRKEVADLKIKLKKLRDEAFLRGGSAKARAIEAGREWVAGSGY